MYRYVFSVILLAFLSISPGLSAEPDPEVIIGKTTNFSFPSRTDSEVYVSIIERDAGFKLKLICEPGHLTALGQAFEDAGQALLEMSQGDEERWFSVDFPTGNITLLAIHSDEGRYINLMALENGEGKPVFATILRPESESFRNIRRELLALISDKVKLEKPEQLVIGGSVVTFTWRGEKVYLTVPDAERYLGYKGGEELLVDLLDAAQARGYRIVSRGRVLELRKQYAGSAFPAGETFSGYYSGGYGNTGYSSGSYSSGGPVHVKGYYRKDGTYVRSHSRSKPSRK